MHHDTVRTDTTDREPSTVPGSDRWRRALVRIVLVLSIAGSSVALAPMASSASTMVVSPSQVTVVCSGAYGSIGRLTGADPNESLSFTSSPSMDFLPAYTSSSGSYTVLWRCDPGDVGTVWSVHVVGSRSARSATFTVRADPAPLPPPSTVTSSTVTSSTVIAGHIEHGHIEHGHIEHGHIEHGHIEHGHIEHGHTDHGRLSRRHVGSRATRADDLRTRRGQPLPGQHVGRHGRRIRFHRR